MAEESIFQIMLDADKKTSESIYAHIKQLILDGILEPGSRLPSERKLTEMLQRSRAVIREALQMLERDGYIRKIPKSSGAIIQLPGFDPVVESLGDFITSNHLNMSEILEFRHLTETHGARLAATRRTNSQLAKLRQILTETRQAFGDPVAFTNCDLLFHMTIAECAHNDMYVIMLNVCRTIMGEELPEILTRGNQPEQYARYEKIYQSHQHIYDAIATRKEQLAYQYMEEHLQSATIDLS